MAPQSLQSYSDIAKDLHLSSKRACEILIEGFFFMRLCVRAGQFNVNTAR